MLHCRVSRLLPLLLAGALAGCGGGVFIGFDIGDDNGDGPNVSLTSSVQSGAPGASVRLSAAASDIDGVESVSFYRQDADAWVLLARDASPPYQIITTLPDRAIGSVGYVARAVDFNGDTGSSNTVTIELLP